MSKRKMTPERREQRKKLMELMQDAGINDVSGVQELYKEMVGAVLENGLEGELEEELGYSKYDYRNKETDNSRNGYSEKTIKTSLGELELTIPRDRKGEFEPQIVKKNQTTLSGDIEEKILSMYAKGMTTGDIEAHIREKYGIEVSDTTISRVTDKILPVVKEWQMRPMENICGGIHGRRTLPRPQRRADRKEGGLRGHWGKDGWRTGRPRNVGWRKRERKILAWYT